MLFTILYPQVTAPDSNHSQGCAAGAIEIIGPDIVLEYGQLNPGGTDSDPFGQEWGVKKRPIKGFLLSRVEFDPAFAYFT